MTKTCLTCSENEDNDMFSETNSKIPMWYKEIGNYSHLPPPINKNPEYNAFRNLKHFTNTNIKGSNLKINIDLKKIIPELDTNENRWFFFWAAKKRNYNLINFPYAPIAYDQFQNSGLAKSNIEGKLLLNIMNPQPYQVEGVYYPPHVHFTYLKKDNTWSTKAWTKIITPIIDKKNFYKLISCEKYIVLNSIPKKHLKPNELIENTHNLPFNYKGKIDTYFCN